MKHALRWELVLVVIQGSDARLRRGIAVTWQAEVRIFYL